MVEQSFSLGSRNGVAEATPFSETILMLFYECRLNGRPVYSILGPPLRELSAALTEGALSQARRPPGGSPRFP